MKQIILIAALTITVAHPTYAQRLEISRDFLQFGIILSKANQALDVIIKHCDLPNLKNVPKLSTTKSPGNHPAVKKYFADCKRNLRQKGVETKSTNALMLLLGKALTFTEAEINILKEAISEN